MTAAEQPTDCYQAHALQGFRVTGLLTSSGNGGMTRRCLSAAAIPSATNSRSCDACCLQSQLTLVALTYQGPSIVVSCVRVMHGKFSDLEFERSSCQS